MFIQDSFIFIITCLYGTNWYVFEGFKIYCYLDIIKCFLIRYYFNFSLYFILRKLKTENLEKYWNFHWKHYKFLFIQDSLIFIITCLYGTNWYVLEGLKIYCYLYKIKCFLIRYYFNVYLFGLNLHFFMVILKFVFLDCQNRIFSFFSERDHLSLMNIKELKPLWFSSKLLFHDHKISFCIFTLIWFFIKKFMNKV